MEGYGKMHLISARVQNFKSINDSSFIEINNKISVIAGRNNSGKTAFIEALNRCFVAPLQLSNYGGSSSSLGIQNHQSSPAIVEVIFKINSEEQGAFEGYTGITFASRLIKLKFLCFNGTSFFQQFDRIQDTPFQNQNINPVYFKDDNENFLFQKASGLSKQVLLLIFL